MVITLFQHFVGMCSLHLQGEWVVFR